MSDLVKRLRFYDSNSEAANRIEELEAQVDDYATKLNPRMWTQEMSHAWHINIPDVRKAFEALRDVKQAIVDK